MAILFLLALEFKVGVVNLRECFDQDRYERIKDVDAELQKEFQTYAEALATIRRRIDNLKKKLEGLQKDMDLYWTCLKELKEAETSFECEKQVGRMRYVNRYNALQLQVYNEIRRVVAMYAKDRGFDLILRADPPHLDSGDESLQGAAAQIQSRAGLWHADSLDITADVIQLLNQEYVKAKAKKR